MEAAHEAGHAAKPHPLTELLASTPLRLAISMVAPVAISFFVGWRVPHQAISLALLAVLLSFPLIALAAITQEEVGACLFSRRWMCSYLDGQGYETYQGAVAKMIHAEVAFEILDGFALLLFFEGAIVLFWGLGRTLI
ncbi:hypothetical protein [Desulfofundulus salinus]|uniref:hypothetical protein n=1 Tax=Desulfofundulus salinus TaxID=2419843 RepID=UPI000F649BF8|nr:hypothetical protein [Desulfofundulus salinum]